MSAELSKDRDPCGSQWHLEVSSSTSFSSLKLLFLSYPHAYHQHCLLLKSEEKTIIHDYAYTYIIVCGFGCMCMHVCVSMQLKRHTSFLVRKLCWNECACLFIYTAELLFCVPVVSYRVLPPSPFCCIPGCTRAFPMLSHQQGGLTF